MSRIRRRQAAFGPLSLRGYFPYLVLGSMPRAHSGGVDAIGIDLHPPVVEEVGETVPPRAIRPSELRQSAMLAGRGYHRLFADPASYDEWAGRWRARLELETCTPQECRDLMRRANPEFIPANHRIEAAIKDAEDGRFDSFHELNDVFAKPCDDQPGALRFR